MDHTIAIATSRIAEARSAMSADIVNLESRRSPKANEDLRTQRHAERRRRSQDILEKLRTVVRVQTGDRAVLAANLGQLVSEVAGSRQAAGDLLENTFKLAFSDNGISSAWKNRKRFVRFPHEKKSDARDHGSYASSGRQYAALADALIKHVAAGGRDADSALQKVVTALVAGTSFDDPAAKFQKVDPDAVSAVREAMAEIEECLHRRVDLSPYFEALQNQPLHPVLEQGNLTAVEISPNLSRNTKVVRPFGYSPAHIEEELAWWTPRLQLGWLYLKQATPALIFGRRDPFFGLAKSRVKPPMSYSDIREKVSTYFKGMSGWKWPTRDQLGKNPNYGNPQHKTAQARFGYAYGYVRYSLWLIVAPTEFDRAGRIRLRLMVDDDGYWVEEVNSDILEDGPREIERLYMNDPEECDVDLEVSCAQTAGIATIFSHDDVFSEVVDFSPYTYVDFDPSDGEAVSLLLRDVRLFDESSRSCIADHNSPDVFRPLISHKRPCLTAAPANSVAGCLLRNLASESENNSIVELLVEDAQNRFDIVTTFVHEHLRLTETNTKANLMKAKNPPDKRS